MPTGNLAVLDTSVYIEIFRTGRFTLDVLRSTWIVRCSSVVLHELRRGARTTLERQFVNELVRKVRIITPTERHWLESAEILSVIGRKKGFGHNKLNALALDALIALSVREIGATLITCNRKDFEEIRRHRAFKVLYW
ncbi:MAG: PIN domain-containing protein [Candidatus Methylomirabilis oxyfera]|nr:PIN domain-containing protein [Candidatus Methylomirabilis oxyfera]